MVADYPVYGVTRHQLYVHPDIPYTSHNSDAVIHVQADGDEAMDHIFEIAEEVMLGDFLEGSDPGLAVASASQIAPALIVYGQDAKCTVLTQERARTLAKNLHIRLKGLGGTEDGVIGAMAGLGLSYAKNDGRFLQKGDIRNILTSCTVERLLESGIDEVWSLDGRQFYEGNVSFRPEKPPRPCPVCGKTVIFVREVDGRLVEDKRD
ncbi:MAG: ABC transporter substrate-binding protein [Methanoregulaceae archaeon]